jgi:hypothetical protein
MNNIKTRQDKERPVEDIIISLAESRYRDKIVSTPRQQSFFKEGNTVLNAK